MNGLTYTGITKSFGSIHALRDVGFSVPEGSLTGLVGSDGAGKTTLIRIAAGLLKPDSGTVTRPPGPVGYLSQGFSLYGDLSIDENMQFFAELFGLARYRDHCTQLLHLMGLHPFRNRRAAHLSGGMKKKLALACAVLHAPRLLLLDEPTTGVDPVSRREFRTILNRLREQGLTILMATPYFDEAEHCDSLVLLHHGRITAAGTYASLSESLPGTFYEVVCSPVGAARSELLQDPSVLDCHAYGDRLQIRLDSTDETVMHQRIVPRLSSRNIRVDSYRRIRPGLESIFISLSAAEHSTQEVCP